MPANVQKKLRSEKVELGGDRIEMEHAIWHWTIRGSFNLIFFQTNPK
jgi:hypothetical protein